MSIRLGQTLVVTPNERQALAAWEADAKHHFDMGEKAWETLPVCSWSDFLLTLWEEMWLAGLYPTTPPKVMNEWQERFLWIEILSESTQGQHLLNLPAAAQLVGEAWRLANAYRLKEELLADHTYWPEDTVAFLGWVELFQKRCLDHHWLERCRLEEEIARCVTIGILPRRVLPREIEFVGFAEWTPAQESLLQSLREAGVETTLRDEVSRAKEQQWQVVPANDEDDELQVAARWLRQKYEENPGKQLKIGLIVPDLSQKRSLVETVLSSVFIPRQTIGIKEADDRPFDISVGRSLARWPIVADALQLLSLSEKSNQVAAWRILFHSPFVGEAELESSARSLMWEKLLKDGRFRVDWSRVKYLARPEVGEETRHDRCPYLSQRLETVQKRLLDTTKIQLPSQWSVELAELLQDFGWPGERSLSSSEYQTVARFNKLLAQLGTLDNLLGTISKVAAVSMVRRMADETVYQPKLGRPQIEVLGTLEALGAQYDYLWMAGFHDLKWPASARPNPYLPFSLQKEHKIAHSTPDRELDFARRVTEQLLTSTTCGVVSYPLHLGDQQARPSPLFAHLAVTSKEALDLVATPTPSRLLFASGQSSLFYDEGPAPISAASKMTGGTSLFKHQAACPFRAFAYLRLNARPPKPIAQGLDPGQRGTLLHLALEHLWKGLRSQAEWSVLTKEKRTEVLQQSAAFATNQMRKVRPDVLRGLMIELETQRLTNLLAEWMNLEEQRQSFAVVATEDRVPLEFAGLHLQATIDRVDRLEDGSHAVIDYKTGHSHVDDWLGERPREPQLPLYAVAHHRSIDTICFAKLRTGDMSFQGLGRTEGSIPGVTASEFASDGTKSWSQRQEEWRENLENLAREFRVGVVRVDPLEGTKTCQYCGLEPLCRIDERDECE